MPIPAEAPKGYCPAFLVRLEADGLFPAGALETPVHAREGAFPEAAVGPPRRPSRGQLVSSRIWPELSTKPPGLRCRSLLCNLLTLFPE